MSIIDGGSFKCGNHDKEYVTDDVNQWQKHLEGHAKKGDLTKFGSASCIVCNKTVDFKDVPNHINPMHEDCRKYLGGQNPQ